MSTLTSSGSSSSHLRVPQGLLGEIEATVFTRQVAQWATNPTAFRELAGHAFNNDPENRKAS
ncbi:hypothetical protein G6038_29130 [Rhodococcus sp. 14C212]|uniref:hypothetical protein n=1 Tax=Rhodococcus sp. 14C212 TaxID=2711209 RepID=UPI0013ED85F2|nr:hypothetical protein [Rhodococcus sp. 14C212]NGP09459.1 hypothetical protein [Rhodococcus sp. 14C212]